MEVASVLPVEDRHLLPVEIRHRIRRGIRSISAVLYAGDELYCPCCQRHLRKFVNSKAGPSLACPACGSLERQRLLMLYLSAETDVLSSRLRLLHFAPEQCLHDRFRAAPLLDYVTADIDCLPMVDVRTDITDLQFADRSFDFMICCHVLEHVPDDGSALREMRRVLRRDGRAFLQHPIDPRRDQTFEDLRIVDPDERLRCFGQCDHVRVYGRDFVARLRDAGFDVECIPYRDQLSPEQVSRSALRDSGTLRADDIYICRPSIEASGRG